MSSSLKLLLVDDEVAILDITKRLLEYNGYEVLLACNGEEALEIYRKDGDEISIVILDLHMPIMDGWKTFGLLKELDPKVCVLTMSGLSYNQKIDELIERGACGYLRKPFLMDDLVAAIDHAFEVARLA